MGLVKLHVEKNTYYDSVTLMVITQDLTKIEGVEEVLVGMGSDLNKELVVNVGLGSPELAALTGNDFFIVAKVASDEIMEGVIAKADELLNAKREASAANYYPPTLESALKMDEALNLAIVSVPGEYAAGVAEECLNKGINVLMFSDNVSFEDEKRIKELAVSKELLMMGPDCGTAIINNVPLAFANVVKPGKIGVVAASGTGTQEITTLIDQMGQGVSQVIGTGGRDLSLDIGGLMFLQSMKALKEDEATKVIVLISKPPAKEIQDKVLKEAQNLGKPVVVAFLGGDPQEAEAFGLTSSISLEDAARKAVALAEGKTPETFDTFTMGMDAAEKIAKEEAGKLAPTQKYLRGLYTGGTLCDEAMQNLIGQLTHIYSNIPLHKEDQIKDVHVSQEHTCLDFGNDEFTVGRPHPMIDPSLRQARILTEGAGAEVGVLLLDCVIGYGAHKDPATDLGEAIKTAKASAQSAGRYLPVVISVCGTDSDPQNLTASRKALEEAGALVLPSNAQAVKMAGLILGNIS